ncbi:MAG: NrsF family protein [Polyangiaceae bacterium]
MTTSDSDPPDLPWPKPAAPSAEVSQAIRQGCRQGLGQKRCVPASHRILASLGLSLGVFCLLAWLTRGNSRIEGTFRSALIGAAGWGIVQAVILWVGLSRPAGKRFSTRLRLVLAVLTPVLFLGYVAHAAPEWVSFLEFSHGERAAHAMRCTVAGLAFSALISGGVLLLWRGTDPFTPGLTGALVGLVGGLAGGLTIGVACPSQEGWHACFSHGLGALAFAGVGWAAGRRLLVP